MSARNNRRTAVRHARRMKVPCSIKRIVEDASLEALVAIITAAAVRMVVPQQFKVGTYLGVDLPDEHGRAVGQVFRVTLARPHSERTWIVEGTFSKKLKLAELTNAQAHVTSSPHGWKTLCRAIHVHHEGPWLATMQDVSRTGIGLVFERSFEPGTFLEISLPSVQRKHLQPKVVRVAHAKRHTDGAAWVLGGIFVRALSEEELQALL